MNNFIHILALSIEKLPINFNCHPRTLSLKASSLRRHGKSTALEDQSPDARKHRVVNWNRISLPTRLQRKLLPLKFDTHLLAPQIIKQDYNKLEF